MQEKVNKWIEDGCIFSEGVALLASTGKYRQLVKSIAGRPHRYAQKLRYELLKYAASSTEAMLASQPLAPSIHQHRKDAMLASQPIATSINQSSTDAMLESQPIASQPKNQLPPEVEQATKLYADAYKTRAILHDAMASLPSGNTPELINKRKEYSDQIAECSLVIETMHKAKDDYYVNGTIPDMKALTSLKPKTDKNTELPDNIEHLKDLRKRMQNSNSKDQFYLDYQQDTRGKSLNPMPKGPKRTKIELRMKSRTEALEQIEIKLNSLT